MWVLWLSRLGNECKMGSGLTADEDEEQEKEMENWKSKRRKIEERISG